MDLNIQTPRWAKDLVSNPGKVRYRGAFGGRGSGKSHLFAEMIVERCCAQKTDVICGREYQKSLKQSAKRLIEDKIQKLDVGHLFELRADRIITPYGGVIIFEGLHDHNSETIKSYEGFDIFWGEEAQTLSHKTLELIRPTIRKETKETGEISELWFSWNPQNPEDPIDVLLRGDEPPDNSVVTRVNWQDNPWFPDVLLEELKYDRKHDIEKYLHVWEGEYYKVSNALVFKNWRVEEFEVPDDAIIRQGADWGYSIDPTILVQCYLKGKDLYVPYEAYQIGCEIDNISLLFQQVPDSEKWPLVADSARPDLINHLRKHGYPNIYPALKGPGSIEDGIEWLKNYSIIVHPRCDNTIHELRSYCWKTEKVFDAREKRVIDRILPILKDKDNHVIDALRYANEGYRRVEIVDEVDLIFESEWGN